MSIDDITMGIVVVFCALVLFGTPVYGVVLLIIMALGYLP